MVPPLFIPAGRHCPPGRRIFWRCHAERGETMWFWERREVYMGLSMEKCGKVRDKLTAAGIPYRYRTVNNSQASLISRRARTGTFGEKSEFAITYYVYVHKKDYERAGQVLRNL